MQQQQQHGWDTQGWHSELTQMAALLVACALCQSDQFHSQAAAFEIVTTMAAQPDIISDMDHI